jgi:hypothetical protein
MAAVLPGVGAANGNLDDRRGQGCGDRRDHPRVRHRTWRPRRPTGSLGWASPLALIAGPTITVGNITAVRQDNIKTMLAVLPRSAHLKATNSAARGPLPRDGKIIARLLPMAFEGQPRTKCRGVRMRLT